MASARRYGGVAVALFSLVVGCGGGEVTETPPKDQTPTCEEGTVACESNCTNLASDPANCGACGTACKPGEACTEGKCGIVCPKGQDVCKGACVDLDKDVANCGKCGAACESGEVCVDGACAVSCPEGQTACDGACVELDEDPENCGECGKKCGAGKVCANGTCDVSCPPGLIDCGGACVDVQKDVANCGECGIACEPGEVCSSGACALTCQPGLTECNGICVDLQDDIANCGGCGVACEPGEVCSAGQCSVSCQEGLTNCNGSCTNLAKNPDNCGACGNACEPGEVCSNGTCALTCQAGLKDCSGVCTDPKKDIANCGACGNVCAAGEVCSNGACALSCQQGLSDCAGVCTDLDKDVANCGACGVACKPGEVCSNGACALSCQQGLTNCSGLCVNLQTDLANCGACGQACGAGQVCSLGQCAVSCQPGLTTCDGTCVDLDSDNGNCGSCGDACPPGTICSQGSCQLTCQLGLTDCGGVCTDLSKDLENCGACGTVCKPGEVCSNGACALSCQPGLTKCNGTCVDLQSDNDDCGACGNACAPGEICTQGTCQLSCQQGLTDCSGVCTDLDKDFENCGACGNACKAGEVCNAGKCAASCGAPLVACNNVCVDTQFNPAHCGACNQACPDLAHAEEACNKGKCVLGGCEPSYLDCNAQQGDGCEVDSKSDAKNCGGCGKVCAAGQACCNSGCLDIMKNDLACGACGNACGPNTKCCGGQCIDPKFQNVGSLDCTKPILQYEVEKGEFKEEGVIDQLLADEKGITTIPANQNPPPAQSPFVWIAMHDSHQVNRVDAKTGAVLGTYSSRGNYPSRGAVALDGSFWVGNRGPNAPNDPKVSNVAQFLPDGSPGCTIGTAADGKPMPFVRAIAIDGNGFVWAGTWNDARLHKIDPAQCKVIASFSMTNVVINGQTYSSAPYGLAVDGKGLLWNSNIGTGNAWLAMDVSSPDPANNKFVKAVPTGGRSSYGIVIDKNDNLYFGQWNSCSSGVWRVDANTLAVTTHSGPTSNCTRGLTLDTAGDIYAAEWNTNPGCVTKFKGGTGQYLGRACFAGLNQTVGIAGDTYGKIWATGYFSNNVTRFSPSFTVDPGFPKGLPGSLCYNYSDWNGMILKTVTSNNAQAGTWTKEFDSGSPNTTWASATWTANTPPLTSVAVYFKAGTSPADFANQEFCGPFYAQPVDLIPCNFGKKQWLQVQVVLNTTDVDVQPSMSDLQIYYQQD